MVEHIPERMRIIESIGSPLGFYVLALIIVEGFLSVVLVFSRLTEEHQYDGLIMGVGMFIFVVLIVTIFVWKFPHNLTYDKKAHLADTGKLNVDFNEEQSLHKADLGDKIEEIVKNAISKNESGKIEFDEAIIPIKNDIVKELSEISSFPIEKESYFNLGSDFEDLVSQCLIELGIHILVQPLQTIRPDFVAIRFTDGKPTPIPIETKFYTKRVIANELPSKLVKQMKMYMNFLKTDESILIISSEVTQEALNLFNKLAGRDKIHIVVGRTKKELKSQLVNILK